MGLFIEIQKLDEGSTEVLYKYFTDEENMGIISINKDSGLMQSVQDAPNDKNKIIFDRVSIKLAKYWSKGEFPDATYWAS